MLGVHHPDALQHAYVMHCRGGLGGAGTAACLFLLDSRAASDAVKALAEIRQVRPGAVETVEQEAFYGIGTLLSKAISGE